MCAFCFSLTFCSQSWFEASLSFPQKMLLENTTAFPSLVWYVFPASSALLCLQSGREEKWELKAKLFSSHCSVWALGYSVELLWVFQEAASPGTFRPLAKSPQFTSCKPFQLPACEFDLVLAFPCQPGSSCLTTALLMKFHHGVLLPGRKTILAPDMGSVFRSTSPPLLSFLCLNIDSRAIHCLGGCLAGHQEGAHYLYFRPFRSVPTPGAHLIFPGCQ